jgi:hypothetical protein
VITRTKQQQRGCRRMVNWRRQRCFLTIGQHSNSHCFLRGFSIWLCFSACRVRDDRTVDRNFRWHGDAIVVARQVPNRRKVCFVAAPDSLFWRPRFRINSFSVIVLHGPNQPKFGSKIKLLIEHDCSETSNLRNLCHIIN